jgi:hypothetical protein
VTIRIPEARPVGTGALFGRDPCNINLPGFAAWRTIFLRQESTDFVTESSDNFLTP